MDSTVSSLRAGDEVHGVFACVRKDRLKTRTGSPYLALELRDRTGSMQARAFRDADALAGRFERGDLISVVGRVERFRDDLVVEYRTSGVRSRAVKAPSTSPSRRSCPSPTATWTSSTASSSTSPPRSTTTGYRALLDSLLADAELRAHSGAHPARATATTGYLGGLLEHTVAVATLARELCDCTGA